MRTSDEGSWISSMSSSNNPSVLDTLTVSTSSIPNVFMRPRMSTSLNISSFGVFALVPRVSFICSSVFPIAE